MILLLFLIQDAVRYVSNSAAVCVNYYCWGVPEDIQISTSARSLALKAPLGGMGLAKLFIRDWINRADACALA